MLSDWKRFGYGLQNNSEGRLGQHESNHQSGTGTVVPHQGPEDVDFPVPFQEYIGRYHALNTTIAISNPPTGTPIAQLIAAFNDIPPPYNNSRITEKISGAGSLLRETNGTFTE